VLGVASRKRSAILPDVPTVAESGLPGYEAYSWAALFAPAHTPQPILNKLNADFNVAMNDPAVRQRMVQAGADADPARRNRCASDCTAKSRNGKRSSRQPALRLGDG
jgi:tripartite-type tricarboxylate transporter receptor subunit TctC